MFCPNCGNKNSTDQKFCRSCGLSLEKTAHSLIEQLPTKLDESLQARKERLEWWGVAALSAFGAGVLGLMLYGIIYKIMIVQGRIWEGIGFLGFIILAACGLLSVILFAKANEVKEASNKQRLQQPEELPSGETTGKLLPESHFEPLPSVTEGTTELLFAEKKRNTKEV